MSKTTAARFSLPRDATLLSRAELERMRIAAGFMGDIEGEERERKERTLKSLKDQATIRKTKIVQKNIKESELSDIDLIRKEEKEKLNKAAAAQLDEETDEAKQMNSLMHYARAVTIRDRQREEKKERKEEEKNNDLRWASLMENERRRDLEERESVENEKARLRKEGAKEVITQIRQRKLEKTMEGEARQREEAERVKKMEESRLEEIEERKRKAIKLREMQEEMARENSKYLNRKAEAKEREYLEDQKMLAYTKEQDAIAMEKEAIKRERMREEAIETAKFREQQEKMIDEQAAKDELNAKRDFEAKERQWRRDQKINAEKRARDERETKEARDLQILSKHVLVEEARERDKAEFEHIVKINREEGERLEAERQRKLKEARDNTTGIRGQIIERTQQKKKEHDDHLNEGFHDRRLDRERTERLNALKAKKVAELRAEQVPEKYIVDLEKLKI